MIDLTSATHSPDSRAARRRAGCKSLPHRAPRRFGLVVAGGVASLALAACGGHAATKQDVIARGNAICAGALRELRAIPPPSSGGTSLPALAAYLKDAVPIVDGEVSSLRALPRPAENRALLNRYVTAMTSSLSAYRSLAAAAQRGDQSDVDQALAAIQASPASKLAGQYGLSQCASAGSTAVSG